MWWSSEGFRFAALEPAWRSAVSTLVISMSAIVEMGVAMLNATGLQTKGNRYAGSAFVCSRRSVATMLPVAKRGGKAADG
jgi:hypothetical protein